MNESTRAWIYRALLAAIIVATAVGLVTEEDSATWVLAVNTLFGLGATALASANTSTNKTPEPPQG